MEDKVSGVKSNFRQRTKSHVPKPVSGGGQTLTCQRAEVKLSRVKSSLVWRSKCRVLEAVSDRGQNLTRQKLSRVNDLRERGVVAAADASLKSQHRIGDKSG